MFLPTSNLDESALFEKSLASHLAASQPLGIQQSDQSPHWDLTRVDLTPFRPLRAKIDCITISWPPHINETHIKEMRDLMKERLKLPADPTGSGFIAVHDPKLEDLRYLIKHFPKCRIHHFEVAVDARLPGGSNDLHLLRQLKEQLRHCIAPQMHDKFNRTNRQFYDSAVSKWCIDSVTHAAPLTTVRYIDRQFGFSLKIYVKTLDQGNPVAQPYLRTELAFDGVANSWAGLEFVDELPNFAKTLRTYCAPAFFVGCGFKNGDDYGFKWQRYGAAWILKSDKGLRIRADSKANRAFGDALNDLSRSLQRL
jgi:hypothetical protein